MPKMRKMRKTRRKRYRAVVGPSILAFSLLRYSLSLSLSLMTLSNHILSSPCPSICELLLSQLPSSLDRLSYRSRPLWTSTMKRGARMRCSCGSLYRSLQALSDALSTLPLHSPLCSPSLQALSASPSRSPLPLRLPFHRSLSMPILSLPLSLVVAFR